MDKLTSSYFELAGSILDQFDHNICLIDVQGSILLVNKAWKKFAEKNGSKTTSFQGLNYFDVGQPYDQSSKKFLKGIKDILSGKSDHIEVDYPCHTPYQQQWFRAIAKPLSIDNQACALIIHENETSKVSYSNEIRLLLKISDIVNNSDFKGALEGTLHVLCETSLWAAGEVWVPNGKYLEFAGARHCNGSDLTAFSEAGKEIRFEKGIGLPGLVWKTGKHQWIENLSKSESFIRKDTAKELGLNSALGIPVKKGEKLYAILAFYHYGQINKDDHLATLMLGISNQLGLLFSHIELQGNLKKERDYMQSIVNDQTEMIIRWKKDGETSFVNDSFCSVYHIRKNDFVGKSFFALLDKEARKELRERVRGLSKDNPVSSGIYKVNLPRNRTAWQHWTDRALFDENDKLIEYQSVGRDITNIYDIELLSDLVIDAAGIGIFESFPKEDKFHFDRRFQEIFEIKKNDVEHFHEEFFNKVHPDDLQRVSDHLDGRLKKNGIRDIRIEYRIRTNNKTKYILSFGKVIRDKNGEADRIVSTIQDITQLRESELIAVRNEKLFKTIVQDQNELIVRWKKGGIRTFVNQAYLDMFELSEEEAIGSSFFNLIPDAYKDQIKNELDQLNPKNPTVGRTHSIKLPDGSTGYLKWVDRAFFDDHGNISEFQSVGRDVTREILSNQKLFESESRLSTIFDNTSDMMFLLSHEDEKYYMETLNDSYLKFAQRLKDKIAKENIIGKEYTAFFNELGFSKKEISEKMDLLYKAVQSKEKVEYLDETNIGDVLMYSYTQLIPIVERTKVKHILCTSRDITSAKNYELKLEETVKELNQLKGKLEEENVYLKQSISNQSNHGDLIYVSEGFEEVMQKVRSIAPLDTTVLITGDTGTGKELIASAIHKQSSRAEMPFIRVNCGAIPRELIESELFGHEKGAFTGAHQARPGHFMIADGGTLMLDEIGEMPQDVQVKLLRALQNSEIIPLGSTKVKKIDVRIIAATNRNLEHEISKNNFRPDLFYRLNIFPIHIPSLKERKEDIPVLVNYFTDKYSKKYNKYINSISKRAMDHFHQHDWPGNIRELENLIERSVILTNTEVLNVPELGGKENITLDREFLTLDEVQKQHITKVLQASKWKIEGDDGAAAKLDLHPSTLRDRMKKLNIKRSGK